MNKFKNNMSTEEKTEIFINECNKIHNNFYDYSKTIYKTCRDELIVTCPKHGDFTTKPNNHMRLGTGCPECGKIKANKGNENKRSETLKEVFDKANKIHSNKYNYDKFIYKNINTKSIITCPSHGDFEISMNKHIYRGQGCPKCASELNMSKGEVAIRDVLTENNINFTYNYIIPNNDYLFNKPYDFYLDDLNILIEYQGTQHTQKKFNMTDEDLEKRKEIDREKRRLAQELGYTFVTIDYKVPFDKINDTVLSILNLDK